MGKKKNVQNSHGFFLKKSSLTPPHTKARNFKLKNTNPRVLFHKSDYKFGIMCVLRGKKDYITIVMFLTSLHSQISNNKRIAKLIVATGAKKVV